MLYIVPFSQLAQVYQYSWFKNGEVVRVVVPHPKLADSIREQGESHRPDLNIEYATIADFINKKISSWNPEIKIYKKYRLILELSTIWKKYFPSDSCDEFLGAFDRFTELRGITTNFEIIEDVVSKCQIGLSEREVEGIKKFWKYLEVREIFDEHGACSYVVEKYRDGTMDEIATSMVFYGFSHLSSGQCDLLKAMGEKHDVYIPVHENVWQEAKKSDWVKWIDAKILRTHQEKRLPRKISLIKNCSSDLNQVVQQLYDLHGEKESMQIILTQKNPDFSHMGAFSLKDAYFKVETSIFGNTYIKIFNKIEKDLDWRVGVETESVLDFLQKLISQELKKEFDKKDFKMIKTASFLHEEIKLWMDLSETNNVMNIFDYNIFRDSLKLNLPRSSMVSGNESNAQVKIRGIEEIDSIGVDGMVLMCASKNYSEMSFSDDHRTEKMIESFLTIGPIKRKEFEFKMFKQNIMDVLTTNSSFLLVEEDLMKENPLWDEILSNFEIEEMYLGMGKEKETKDYIAGLKKRNYSSDSIKWSSGKIQKYLDCPRSFYYKYVDRIHFSPEKHLEVEMTDLGTLQHQVIKMFLENFETLDEDEYQKMVKLTWDRFLDEKRMILDGLNYEHCLLEIKNYSWRGIKALFGIKKEYPQAKFSFEFQFDYSMHRGSVDCVVNLDNKIMGIVDFKRSGTSIPSRAEFLDFKKIQLWYYMYNLHLQGFNLGFLGYLCLAEPDKSQVVFDDQAFPQGDFDKIFVEGKKYSCSFKEKLSQFDIFLKDKIENILQDDNFLPIPRVKKACDFCWLDKICIREKVQKDANAQ